MCDAPDITAPPPPPAPPPTLEQLAPKSAGTGGGDQARKRKGLSRYKIEPGQGTKSRTNKLGGVPSKTGV